MNTEKINKKTKVLAVAITGLLLLSMMAFVAPFAQAATERQPYAFLSIAPNPVGVGQSTLIVMWLDLVPTTAYPGQPTKVWQDYTLTITAPDGSVETMTEDSDPVASVFISWTPKQTGNYTLQFKYPGEVIGDLTMKEAESPVITLEVQEEPIPEVINSPLPTEYWTRPIQATNRGWVSIANNWYGIAALYGASVNGLTNWVETGSAPDSAHIMWTKELQIGGLASAELGDIGYYSGASYENKWSNTVIINGKLYVNARLGGSSNLGLRCIDMATGEELWFQNGTTISCGQVLNFDCPNQHGAFPYLWSMSGSTYKMYDANTGIEILQIVNATGGARFTIDANGNLIGYIVSGANNWVLKWNSTKCIVANNPGNPYGWQWRPTAGARIDWSKGIEWNNTVTDVPGNPGIAQLGKNTIICANTVVNGSIVVTGYSTEDGRLLFTFNQTSSASAFANFFFTGEVDGKFAWFRQETMQWYGFDATTGKKIWGPTEPYSSAWGMYTTSVNGLGASSPVIAYGKLYAVAYDGMIHCYDMETGNNDWNYYIGDSGYETPYGTWPLAAGMHVAVDGKIYAATGEHSPSHPLTRGAKIVCVNATTGEEIWRQNGWFAAPAVADGQLVSFSQYDNFIYCFGKGPSQVTVDAPDVSVTMPASVLIKGTVTDISVGTSQNVQTSRFPEGVPAVSDDSMSDWMQYVYQQGERPTNATGVKVTLDVLDANGNYRNIGETTSDANGFYSYEWCPDIAGKYTIYATFAGSDSYWPSHSQTAFVVADPAPTATPSPEPPQSMADMYFVPAVAGIIVAILLVGVVLALLLLRKRP
jgi:outer membrane protein assembly factor BamB